MKMYWFDKEFHSQVVRETMTFRRFQQIENHSCMYSEKISKDTGESDPKSVNYDPNFKVTPCWRAFFIDAQSNKNPTVSLAEDETIIPCKVLTINHFATKTVFCSKKPIAYVLMCTT